MSVFGVILVRIFPHSAWIRRDMVNADQNNSENGHFSRRSQIMELRPNKKEPKWWIRNVSIIISCFHVRIWGGVVSNMQWGGFKSCWNASDAWKYIWNIITSLYLLWFMKFLGRIFWAPTQVNRPPKCSDYDPGISTNIYDGTFCEIVSGWISL